VPGGAAVNKSVFVLLLMFGCATASRSQSIAELSEKYPVVTAFEIRPGILMTPKYTDEGKICRMSFERQHATRSGNYLGSVISDKLAKDIVDQLAPPTVRGKESKSSGAISIVGILMMTDFDYENVAVTFLGDPNEAGTTLVVITWKNRICENEGKQLPLEQYPH
jgi:hypothetical protein